MKKVEFEFETKPHEHKNSCKFILRRIEGKYARLTIVSDYSTFWNTNIREEYCQLSDKEIDKLIENLKEVKGL